MTPWRRTPLNVLIAYPYCTAANLMWLAKCPPDTRILVDSGAFTAWRSGKSISVAEFSAFLHALPIKPWRVFTLDVVGEHDASMRNYLELLELGHKVVPIFTRGAPLAHLDVYYQTSDLVAVGGLVGTKGSQGFIKGIQERIGDRLVHWLGFTRQNYLRHYKPYSCDSSSWGSGARYGQLQLYMGRGQFAIVRKEHFRTRPSADVIRVVESYGVSHRDLGRNDSWNGAYSLPRRLGAGTGVRYSMELERLGITMLFLAFGTTYEIERMLLPAYHHELNRHQEVTQ